MKSPISIRASFTRSGPKKSVAGILSKAFTVIDELKAHQQERAEHAANLRAQVVELRREAYEAEQEVLRAGSVSDKIEALVS